MDTTYKNPIATPFSNIAGAILERKDIHAIFQKKDKIFENLDKNVQNLKIF